MQSVDLWLEPPNSQRAFCHMEDVVATQVVARGSGPTRRFAIGPRGHGQVVFASSRGEETITDFVARAFTDGWVMLRGNRVELEYYGAAMTSSSRHLLMSVSKSVTGMLAGALIERGDLRTDARVSEIVPELERSAFGEATVQSLLDMTTRVKFSMEFGEPDSEVLRQDRVAGWRPPVADDPATSRMFLASLRPDGEHGLTFQYCSATTDALAWVLEAATGTGFRQLLTDVLWSRIGAEHDALVTVDAAGFPYAAAGVCTTLMDLARFGRLLLDDGRWNGRQVVPPSWIKETFTGAGVTPGPPDATVGTVASPDPDLVYHNQWWVTKGAGRTAYAAGLGGQYLWLDPVTDVVIAKVSSAPLETDVDLQRDHIAAFRAMAANE